MPLTGKQRQYLRGLAHHQKPVVLIGNAGLSDAVINEIDLALATHELLKIKLPGEDKEARQSMIEMVCDKTAAEFVQSIGRIVVIYRPSEKSRILLPR